MIINPYAFGGGGGGGDPYFANVVALLHFDGVDGSTTFTDQTGKTWTPTGSAQLDTAQARYGPSSLLLDGSGDFLTTPSSSDFAYGTGDFTWETSFRLNALGGGNSYIIDHGANGGTLFVNGTTGRIGYYNATTGIGSFLYDPGAGGDVTTGTWYDVAVSRVSGTTRLILGGAVIASAADAHSYAAQAVSIGQYGGGGNNFNGWIDELRLTNGVGRYTSGYTPTGPFPDS